MKIRLDISDDSLQMPSLIFSEKKKKECCLLQFCLVLLSVNIVSKRRPLGWCEGAVYLTSPGRPTDIGLQLGKACYPCSG